MKKARIASLLLALALLGAAGYALLHGGAPRGAGPAGAGAGAPVAVTTVRAEQRDLDVLLESTGTVTALNSVEIRPQIASVITRIHFREGQYVKAGELLFSLDARNDEVNLAKARAQLARDNASLADFERQLARSRELRAENFVSQGAVDTNQAQVDAQRAAVVADRAAIEAAQVGLSYTRIVAPTAGRAGAVNVYVGTTVQPTGAALVTITQLDPIAVAFSVPQRHLDDALRALRGAGRVTAALPDQRGQAVGQVQFVDNLVDPGSGTVRVKAHFANPDETLWPGAFVAVRLSARRLEGAIVIPHAAVISGPRGDVVYTVDAAGKAVARPVEVVYAQGTDAAVRGVSAGERVVLDGRQNLRAGVAVVEHAARPAAGASAGDAASAPEAAGGAAPANGGSGAAAGAANGGALARSTP